MELTEIFSEFAQHSIGWILLKHSDASQAAIDGILEHQSHVIAYCNYIGRKPSVTTASSFKSPAHFQTILGVIPPAYEANIPAALELAQKQDHTGITADADIFPEMLVTQGLLSASALKILLLTRTSFRILNLSNGQQNTMTTRIIEKIKSGEPSRSDFNQRRYGQDKLPEYLFAGCARDLSEIIFALSNGNLDETTQEAMKAIASTGEKMALNLLDGKVFGLKADFVESLRTRLIPGCSQRKGEKLKIDFTAAEKALKTLFDVATELATQHYKTDEKVEEQTRTRRGGGALGVIGASYHEALANLSNLQHPTAPKISGRPPYATFGRGRE